MWGDLPRRTARVPLAMYSVIKPSGPTESHEESDEKEKGQENGRAHQGMTVPRPRH